MEKLKKQLVKKLVVVIIITASLLTVFSIPIISMVAPLGNILFPGTGLWRAPGEVPEAEVLYIEGLDDEVTVYRDEWGIPHVYAETEKDLSFALGYVHAQDRFFQMDMARRSVRGLLSEVVGEMALESDKYNLAMGMEYWANESLKEAQEMQEDGEIEFLDAWERYVEGINYYLETHQDEWPVEYSILGFKPTDRPWTLLDSMCYSKYMSKMLTWNYYDLYRLSMLDALGQTKYDQIMSPYLPYQIPVVPDYGVYNESELLSTSTSFPQPSSSVVSAVSQFIRNVENIDSEAALMQLQKEDIIGSNNWVVDGIKSSTGKPILCNDMHLAWSLPGIWYEAHLVAEKTDLNTYGFTLAGVPLPIVGHNEHVAWGMTNTGLDVLDWYYYEEVDDDHYTYDGSKKEYKTRDYSIPVKGGQSEPFTVKETVHGPVLSDFLGDTIPDTLDDDKIVIAPRWTANNVTFELLAIYGFNHAKNRADFNQSSEYFHNPAQNLVYADIDDNIAIRPTGLVPIRDGNGTFPYDGSAGEGEWSGYIPFADLPQSVNPDQHYLASANQISAGPNYTKNYFLQNEYSDGYRARRINELLNNSEDGTVGVEKMKEIQLDVKSSSAQSFTEYLIDAVEALSTSDRTEIMDDILTELKNWDFDMDKDLPAPTIYRKWRDYFEEYTFKDEMDKYDFPMYPQMNVLEKFMREEPNNVWFDDVSTSSTVEDRDDIIIKALEKTIDSLKSFYNTEDVDKWEWGQMHKVSFPHILDLEPYSAGPYESDGSGHCVNPSRVNLGNGVGVSTGGASERMIVDFSDLENSVSCIPSGQRGITNSKHYSDQLEELFLKGKYHNMYFADEKEDFPKSQVESYISFIPTEELPQINFIFPILLIGGFIGGVVIFIKFGYPKLQLKRSKEVPATKPDQKDVKLKENANINDGGGSP